MGVLGWIQEILSVITCLLALFAASWAYSARRDGREIRRLMASLEPALQTMARSRLATPTEKPLRPRSAEAIAEVPMMIESDFLARIDTLAKRHGVSSEEMMRRLTLHGLDAAQHPARAREILAELLSGSPQHGDEEPESTSKKSG